MKPRGFPTLHEIAKQSIADSWNFNKINNVNGNADSAITLHPSEFTIPHIEEPSTSPSSYELPEATYRELLSLHLRELRLAEHIINSFQSAKTCISCKKSCFDTYIRKYEVTRARNSILYALCSQQCAQADEKFSTRTLFRYTGQQDID